MPVLIPNSRPEVTLMHSPFSKARAPRPVRWRVAFVSGLAVLAIAGGAMLGPPQPRVAAQQSLLPPGAPLSFADLVERVKPAVVSIQVTSQGPKMARSPQEPRGPGARPPQMPWPDENNPL